MNSVYEWMRRYPYAVACVVLALGLAVAAWFLNGRIRELRSALAERTREGENMLSLLVGGSVQRQELAFARETARRIEESLIVESNLAENTWYFFKLEELHGARLSETHQLSSPIVDRSPLYKRIPYSLRVGGTHEQVSSFLWALETGPRLVRVTAFNLSRGDIHTGQLSLELNVEILGKK